MCDLAAPGGFGFGTNSLPGANDHPGHKEYGCCKDVGGFKVTVQRAVFMGKMNCVGEQSKRIARAIAQTFTHGLSGVIMGAGSDPKLLDKYLEDMLKTAGLSRTEIDEAFERSASAHKP
jgi:hypothetical protein